MKFAYTYRRYPLIFILLTMTVITLCGCGVSGDVKEDLLSTDTLPPTISSTYPADGATGVAVNTVITATFSETMDTSTFPTAIFTLSPSSGAVTGTGTYTGTTATFTPSGNLAYNTTYTATISAGVKDAAGNAMTSPYTWTFATGTAPDTTPPTVSSTSPADNATGVAVNTAITATFNETMTASTITTATFSLLNGATPVSGNVNYTGTTATFTPSDALEYSTPYTATISTDVKDAAGNAMADNYTWTFTTGSAPGTAILTWEAPTINADGTILDDLAGYKIYYGTSTGNYSIPIEKPLGSAGLNCLAIQSKTECSFGVALVSGIYCFSVTAYDTLENESAYSNEISKTIP